MSRFIWPVACLALLATASADLAADEAAADALSRVVTYSTDMEDGQGDEPASLLELDASALSGLPAPQPEVHAAAQPSPSHKAAQKEAAQLQAQLAKLQGQVAKLTAEAHRLRKAVATKKAAQPKVEASAKAQPVSLAQMDLEQEYTALQAEKREEAALASKEMQTLANGLHKAEGELHQKSVQLKSQGVEMEALAHKNKKLSNIVAALHHATMATSKQHAVLLQTEVRLSHSLKTLQGRARSAELANKRADISLEEASSQLQREVAAHTKLQKDVTAKIELLQQQLHSSASTMAAQETQLKQLRAQSVDEQHKRAVDQTEAAKIQHVLVARSHSVVHKLTSKVRALATSNNRALRQTEAAQAEAKRLLNKLQTQEPREQKLQREVQEAQEQRAHVDEELLAAKKHESFLEVQNKKLVVATSALQHQDVALRTQTLHTAALWQKERAALLRQRRSPVPMLLQRNVEERAASMESKSEPIAPPTKADADAWEEIMGA